MAKKTQGRADVLSALCAAVAAYYKDKGDRTQAGVVIACLDFDPPDFYASVARYPNGPMGPKSIVCSVGGARTQFAAYADFTTAEGAVADLASKWHKLVTPPPVQSALSALGEALGEKP